MFPFKIRNAINYTPANVDVDQFSGVYVGGTGNLVVRVPNGLDVTFTAVPTGTFVPIPGRQVRSTTTATAIVLVYS
jgi:hypothetical protein